MPASYSEGNGGDRSASGQRMIEKIITYQAYSVNEVCIYDCHIAISVPTWAATALR
jgi:hypothetical protein